MASWLAESIVSTSSTYALKAASVQSDKFEIFSAIRDINSLLAGAMAAFGASAYHRELKIS